MAFDLARRTYQYLIGVVNIGEKRKSGAGGETFVIFAYFGLDIISSAT
jgi:hypothetical protein